MTSTAWHILQLQLRRHHRYVLSPEKSQMHFFSIRIHVVSCGAIAQFAFTYSFTHSQNTSFDDCLVILGHFFFHCIGLSPCNTFWSSHFAVLESISLYPHGIGDEKNRTTVFWQQQNNAKFHWKIAKNFRNDFNSRNRVLPLKKSLLKLS